MLDKFGTRSPKSAKGLTLIELLVAISVLGMVAILGWRGLDSIVRARIALTEDLEQIRGMQIAFAQLQSDCAHLAGTGTLLKRSSLVTGPGRLLLVRTVFVENQPSALQVITYQLSDGTLSRSESIATRDLGELDALWQATTNMLDSPHSPLDKLRTGVTLQSDIANMTMRVWVEGSWRTGTDLPTPTAGTVATPSAPTGLEITLQLHGSDSGVKKIFLLGAA